MNLLQVFSLPVISLLFCRNKSITPAWIQILSKRILVPNTCTGSTIMFHKVSSQKIMKVDNIIQIMLERITHIPGDKVVY